MLKKYPLSQPPKPSTIVSPIASPPFHPVVLEGLDGVLIRHTILCMDGAASLDVAAWKNLCTSFRGASDSLCAALAAVARRLATSFVDPAGLAAFTACRLIALNKNPADLGQLVLGRFVGDLLLNLFLYGQG